MKNKKKWIINILIPVIIGGAVGLLISRFMDYNDLNKPPLSPPGFLFGIMWTILYILMGVSYSILDINNLMDKKTKLIYYTQLIVNVVWPILFFIFKARLLSCIWIILLFILILYMIITFYKRNKLSAYLQIPYLIWTAFATYLNIGVYTLNK